MSAGNSRLTRRRFLQANAMVLLPAGIGVATPAAAADLVIVPIVSADSSLRDIPIRVLERVFLARPVTADDGRLFVPFNHLPKTKPRVLFDQRVLGMSADEVARHWVDQRIRGNTRPPRAVASVALLKQVVHQFPGAISYVPVRDLDDSVRPLRVGGIHHDAHDYPIK